MGMRFAAARGIAAVSTWGLTHIFHRPAANFPGKIALYVDPQLIADLSDRVQHSICVVGTNGKTTVTNLIADVLEANGDTVICNRTGANLDSGVSTALLHGRPSQWGVFECDELWLAKILPGLRSDYVLLLNLFRDQLDRVGEIDHIQESIAKTVAASPNTVLVYNCDDPLCQAIADAVPNQCVPFGVAQDMHLAQNIVADARMCQECSSMLEYEWRQYGQLGQYACPTCGFKRSEPEYTATDVKIEAARLSFSVVGPHTTMALHSRLAGAYMVYNLLGVAVVAQLAGADGKAIQAAIDEFDPKNGRLQSYKIAGQDVLLNLAKNPTGFNQNLKIIMAHPGPKAVAFFINDKEADGHDVSWLWDIDFQELAADPDLHGFAGGIRKNDMQVRLKYGGVPSSLVDDARDFITQANAIQPGIPCFVIANYTALPGVKAQLDEMQELQGEPPRDAGAPIEMQTEKTEPARSDAAASSPGSPAAPTASSAPTSKASSAAQGEPSQSSDRKLTIAHMYPTLLNLYGDGGNVTVLAERARRRGIDVDVVAVDQGDKVDVDAIDIMFLGGGPDREQHLASQELLTIADDIRALMEDDGVILAICGGFQILGEQWLMGDESVAGLGLLPLSTERREGGSHNRIVDNIALKSPLAEAPVIGYENHAGRTYLDGSLQPFGAVMGNHGKGNNDEDRSDGVLYRNVVGTYLHGPLLAKNPQVADELLQRALDRRAKKEGIACAPLEPLDDSVELSANAAMAARLGVR